MKSRRFIPTVLAVVVLIGLVVYIAIRRPADPEERARAARTIFALDSNDIDRIHVANAAGTFTFERGDGDRWALTEPMAVPAEGRRINAMRSALGHLTAAAIAWSDATDADRAQVGLAPPATTVTFRAAGEEHELTIGQLHPSGDEYYVARGDRDAIYTVRKWTLEVFQKDLPEYRRRQILTVDRDQVVGVKIRKHGTLTLAFERADKDAPWRFTAPLVAPADSDVVTTLVSKLVLLRAEDFVDAAQAADPARLGFEPPAWSVELVTGPGEQVLEFGADAPTETRVAFPPYYVRAKGARDVYTTSSPLRRDLGLPVREWRDEDIARFDTGKVNKVRVTLASGTASARKEETWRTDGEHDRFADPQAMALLRHLDQLTATEFVSDAPASLKPYGLVQPQARLDIELVDGSHRTYSIGTTVGGSAYVKSDEFSTVYKADVGPVLEAAEALHRLATADELESATIVIERDDKK